MTPVWVALTENGANHIPQKKLNIDRASMKYLAPELYVILSLTIIS